MFSTYLTVNELCHHHRKLYVNVIWGNNLSLHWLSWSDTNHTWCLKSSVFTLESPGSYGNQNSVTINHIGWIKNQTGPVDTEDLPVSSVPLLPARLTPLLLATHEGGVNITSLLQRSPLSQHFRYGHISCFLTSGLLFSHRIGVLPLKDCRTSVRSL